MSNYGNENNQQGYFANSGSYRPGGNEGVQSYGSHPQENPFINPAPSTQTGVASVQGSPSGFLGSLFDFSFDTFITPKVVKLVYVLSTAAVAFMWLILLVTAFAKSIVAGVLVLLIGPLVALLYLVFIRLTLEFYLAVVRMSEDIHHRLR